MHIKTLSRVAGLVLTSVAVWAQPQIRDSKGVLNASSYTEDIARGSWFVVFGTGLGPSTLTVYNGNLPFPDELSDTKITFTPATGGQGIDTRMWYTSATQAAALLPSSTAAGDYDVKVTYKGQTSAAKRVKVVERNFGFATQSSNGQGPAQATYGGKDLNRFSTDANYGGWSIHPAKAGDTVVLWGTGLGADQGSDTTGASAGDQTVAAQAKVIVGGKEVTPVYAGRSSGSPGLDQVMFVVPADVTPDCFVSVSVRAGGRVSNAGTIAVATPGQSACSSSTFTAEQLARLDKGGTLTTGTLSLSKTTLHAAVGGTSFDMNTESASGDFVRQTIDAVGASNFALNKVGNCYVYRRTGTQEEVTAISGTGTLLDAGPQLTLNGPNANALALTKTEGVNSYNKTLYSSGYGGIVPPTGTPTIADGKYTMEGVGGADIGAFSASIDVPGAFNPTLPTTDPISRSTPLAISWTGGSSGLVMITGVAGQVIGSVMNSQTYDAGVFVCVAQASAGSFTVPTSVLQQLPAVATSTGDTTGLGLLSVMAVPDTANGQGKFTAPLTVGGNLDAAFFMYDIGIMKTTGWQ